MGFEALKASEGAQRIAELYLALLRVPLTDPFHIANQDIYARVRDELAKRTHADGESVQDAYEAVARALYQ